MLRHLVRSAVLLTALTLLVAIQPCMGDAVQASPTETATYPDRSPGDTNEELTWFQWDDNVYAMTDDGQAIWLGTAMGALRWDKTTGDVERYTTIDGLPSTHVFAVAVDDAGNRWFGGDGGLSRLDVAGNWSHFSPDNSGMAEVLVDGLAVGADGTLWLSHGLPDGPVSRLDSNGLWTAYPGISTVITADYQAILATENKNPLWLVTGDEVWVGFWVYDGIGWHDRLPNLETSGRINGPNVVDTSRPRPTAIDVDSSGVVWVMVEIPEDTMRILSWNDTDWTDNTPLLCWGVELQTLAVDLDDTVWVGYSVRTSPPGSLFQYAAIMPLSTETCVYPAHIDRKPPVQVLLASQSGIWSAGPGWLLRPDGAVADIATVSYSALSDVLVDNNNLWLHTYYAAIRYNGVIQYLDDQQTSMIEDDRWQQVSGANVTVQTGWDITSDGDVIVTWYSTPRWNTPEPPYRWHDGNWIEYQFNQYWAFFYDAFVQDTSHFWFTASWDLPDYGNGVIELDDRGTPMDPTDDLWTIYRIDNQLKSGTGSFQYLEPSVAVDSLNRIWYADASGVYKLNGNTWERKLEIPACDLVPGRWGVVNVILPYQGTSCDQLDMTVVIIDGSHIYSRALEDFARSHAQYAPGSNRLWSVAPDGLVWYYWRPDNTVRSVAPSQQGAQNSYPLPVGAGPVRTIQAGSGSRVWIVAGDNLWRLAPQPGFSVSGFSGWLLEPGTSATRAGQVVATGTWNWPVSLDVTGLPPEISAGLEPVPAQPGGNVTMTVQVSPAATPGNYPAQFVGQGGATVQTQTLTITVASQVYPKWLPLADRSE